jgi:hemerythrin-like domain-containing protein
MQPIGPLMREHRLIERVVGLLERDLEKIGSRSESQDLIITAAVDFLRTYADRTHHGKEEDILFRELGKKQLSPDHKRIMSELVEEHTIARKTVGNLARAHAEYLQGNRASLAVVETSLKELVALYPRHIEKEDTQFFFPSMEYFTRHEMDLMLQEFEDFDSRMIHERYQRTVEELETQARGS